MTTHVIISLAQTAHRGVKVEVQGRDLNGQFKQNDEVTILPGECRELLVHGTQNLQVIELPEPAASGLPSSLA